MNLHNTHMMIYSDVELKAAIGFMKANGYENLGRSFSIRARKAVSNGGMFYIRIGISGIAIVMENDYVPPEESSLVKLRFEVVSAAKDIRTIEIEGLKYSLSEVKEALSNLEGMTNEELVYTR